MLQLISWIHIQFTICLNIMWICLLIPVIASSPFLRTPSIMGNLRRKCICLLRSVFFKRLLEGRYSYCLCCILTNTWVILIAWRRAQKRIRLVLSIKHMRCVSLVTYNTSILSSIFVCCSALFLMVSEHSSWRWIIWLNKFAENGWEGNSINVGVTGVFLKLDQC